MESKRSGVERDPWRDQTMPLKLPGSSTLLIPSAAWDDGPTDLSESISTAGLASELEPVAMRDALTALRGLLDSATPLDAAADVAVRDALTAIRGLLDSTPLAAAAGHAGFSAAPPAGHLPDGLGPTIADARPGQLQAVMQADPRGVDFHLPNPDMAPPQLVVHSADNGAQGHEPAHKSWLISDNGQQLDTPEQAGAGSAGANSNQPVGTIPQLADFLLNGYWGGSGHHWGTNTVTYNFGNLTVAEQALATAALNAWHDVANVTFVATLGVGNINFNHNGTMTASTSASWTNGLMVSATVDISTDWVNAYGTGIDTYSYQTYLHEIRHALGLGHQGPYNATATYGTDNIYANDTWQFSVMSYFGQNNYGGASYRFVKTPMMAYIYAVDSVYGAATTTRTGDTVYGFNSTAGSLYNFASYSTAPALTIYDSSGNDTLDCSGYSVAQTIDLRPGYFSSIGGLVNNIGIATSCTIEKAIGGSGGDTLIGNGANDFLVGGGGNDTIIGGTGTNTAIY